MLYDGSDDLFVCLRIEWPPLMGRAESLCAGKDLVCALKSHLVVGGGVILYIQLRVV